MKVADLIRIIDDDFPSIIDMIKKHIEAGMKDGNVTIGNDRESMIISWKGGEIQNMSVVPVKKSWEDD